MNNIVYPTNKWFDRITPIVQNEDSNDAIAKQLVRGGSHDPRRGESTD